MDHVFVTGRTIATSITIDGVTLASGTTGSQLFTLAFDATGVALWGAISASPGGTARGHAISVDGSGSVYVAGVTNNDLVIDGITLSVGNQQKAVLVAYDNTGVLTHMEVIDDRMPTDMVVDDAGQAYVCGYTAFGNDWFNPSMRNGFVAAYPGDGTCRWTVGVSGALDEDLCQSVSLNAAQTKLIVSGTFSFDEWFGALHVQTIMNNLDGFIMHLDTAGTVDWGRT